MPLFITSDFPPPLGDKEFEEMVRDIFAAHWNDPNTKIFGRSGQEQSGVDIYGQPNQMGSWFGIQCKVRKTGQLTRKDFEHEIELAHSFHKKLHTYIFATTALRDTKLQQIVDMLNEIEIGSGGFNVQIRFWEDLSSLLSENTNLVRKYYPQYFIKGMIREAPNLPPLRKYPNEITPESPMLVGLVIDFSRSMLKILKDNPGFRNSDLQEAVDLVIEKAVAFCKTPEANEVLPKFALFAYGFGFKDLRKRLNNVFDRLLGTDPQKVKSEIYPTTPVRDLFAEVAAAKSLPYTPNIQVLYRSWDSYRQSVENQFLDMGLGPSNLYESLCMVRDRLSKELERPYFKHPLIVLISDGQVDDADAYAMTQVTNQIQAYGAQIMHCYVSQRDITRPKNFYAEPQDQWTKEVKQLFHLSSIFVDSNPLLINIATEARERGWQVPERARLFMQINHKEMLDELVEILLSSLKD